MANQAQLISLWLLPFEATHHRGRTNAGCRQDIAKRRRIGLVASAQLLRMNTCGHEQTVDVEGGGALEIGAYRISDRHDAAVVDGVAAQRLRARNGLLVD